LHVSEADDEVGGKVLLHCFAGCTEAEIMTALGLPRSALFPPQADGSGAKHEPHTEAGDDDSNRGPQDDDSDGGPEDHWTLAEIYHYLDGGGEPVYNMYRFVDAQGQKHLRPRQLDGTWGLTDAEGKKIERVLYQLPDVLRGVREGRRIFVCEGEKDVEAVRDVEAEDGHEIATCAPFGANGWKDLLARALYGAAEVIVCRDKDQGGDHYARSVVSTLGGHVGVLRVVEAKEGDDISDHLDAKWGLDDLMEVEVDQTSRRLPVISARDLDAKLASAPRPVFLINKVWPEDAYGVIAAQDKAGKTFLILDAAVSVSSGTPWLGCYDIERAGTVLAFLGEGGERKMHRRACAIAESRSLEFKDLDIQLCFRVPHLSNQEHLGEVADLLATHRPVLVILDPLYLAARGAKSSQLNDMGGHLESIQLCCQEVGAALMVVHHWNQTGSGTGPERFSGAGPAEWGRVRVSMAVQSKEMGEDDHEESDVTFALEFSGDETMDRQAWFRRRIWTDDASDLAARMHYRIKEIDAPEKSGRSTDPDDGPDEDVMEQVSAIFAKHPGKRLTQERALEVLKPIKKRLSEKITSIERLVELEYMGDDGTSHAHKYFFIKLYRRQTESRKATSEAGDDDEDLVVEP
jgi:hypothetical protein